MEKQIADYIIKVMASKGVTVEQLAIKLARREGNIRRWLRGDFTFRISHIVELQLALNVQIINIS